MICKVKSYFLEIPIFPLSYYLLIGFLFSMASLEAGTIFVKPIASGNLDGTNWSNSANLQNALISASPGDEIWVAAGNYIPGPLETDTFIVAGNITLLGGFSGVESSANMRDWSTHQTILSGEIQDDANSSNNADAVVTFAGNHITFSGFIVEEGHSTTNGGGILAAGVFGVIIEDSVFRNNLANSAGGVFLNNISGTSYSNTVRNCIFADNEALFNGGGLFLDSQDNGANADHVYNCLFVRNKGTKSGAGLYYSTSGVVSNLTFYKNEDTDGTGDDPAQLSVAGLSSSGVVRNSIFSTPINTNNLSSWKTNAGAASVTFENCMFDTISKGSVSAGLTAKLVTGSGTFTSTDGLVNSSNVTGADLLYFTTDDGFRLTSSSNAIGAGNALAPYTDKDILGMSRAVPIDLGAYANQTLPFMNTVTLDINKRTPGDGGANDQFSGVVAISGNVAVMGATGDDDMGANAGAAYIYVNSGGNTWTQHAKIFPTGIIANDQVGSHVAIDGNVIIVGSSGDDDLASASGSSYVFVDDGNGNWSQQAKLVPSDSANDDWAGTPSAISGNIAVMGSWRHSTPSYYAGAAWVFVNDGGSNWNETQKLQPADGTSGDQFGVSVWATGNVIFAGANKDSDNGAESGSVYVFVHHGSGSWVEHQKLLPSDGVASAWFGTDVEAQGNLLVVGSRTDDDMGVNTGSAYIFRDIGGGNWVEEAKLLPPDAMAGDSFGSKVSISGNLVTFGGHGVNGAAGAAWVYANTHGSTWEPLAKLEAPDGAASDILGIGIAISGNTVIAGSRGDDDNGADSGSAYFFQLGVENPIGQATPSSNLIGNWPMDDGSGTLVTDSSPNANHGSFIGSPQWVSGLGGDTALAFNGSTDMVLIDDIPAYDIFNQLTLSTWVYPTATGQTQALIYKNSWGDSERSFALNIKNTNELAFTLASDGVTNGITVTGNIGVIQVNQWNLVTATWDGSDVKIFINGVLDAQAAYAGPFYTGASNIQIGGYFKFLNNTTPYDYFSGNIQDVDILDVARSDAEILATYQQQFPSASIQLIEFSSFTAPAFLERGGMAGNTVLKFELTAGTNPEIIDGFNIGILGDVNDLDYFEIMDVTGSPFNVYGGNAFTGNVVSGNINFNNNPFVIVAGNTRIFELAVDVKPTTSTDNIEFVIEPLGVYSGNMLAGNVIVSGLINFIGGAVSSPPELVNDSGFTPPVNLMTSTGPTPVLIWNMDTENTGYDGNITAIEFDVFGANPGSELAGALVYDLSSSSLISNSPSFGSNTITFTGISWALSSAANSQLELKVTTNGSFSANNIQFDLQASKITLADNATVSGTPISSGTINLQSSSPAPHLVPVPSFSPPGSIATNLVEESVFSFEMDSTTEGYTGNITNLEFKVMQADPSLEFVSYNLFNVTDSTNISNSANVVAGNIVFSGLEIPLSGGSNTVFELQLDTGPSFSSANVEFILDPLGISLNDSAIVGGSPVSSGPIALSGGNTNVFDQLHIAAGRGVNFAIDQNDTLVSMGQNDINQTGGGGDLITAGNIASDPVMAVSSGERHSIALALNGDIITWGSHHYGQSNPNAMVQTDNNLPPAVQVEAGAFNSFVITGNNQLWAKGRNHVGQLGIGDTTDRSFWVQVSLPAGNIRDISAGIDHTLVIIDGVLYGFGSNGFGQLGNPDTSLITSTAGVINDAMVWDDVEAGGFHSLAVNDSGQAYAWGKNSHGQLGTGDRLLRSTPTAIAGMTNVVGLAAGYEHSLFLVDNASNRSCYAVGSNQQGQSAQSSPLVLSPMMVDSYTTVVEITAGPYSSMLILNGVSVKQWGQMGDGRKVNIPEVFTEL